jgi:hypothetical protein
MFVQRQTTHVHKKHGSRMSCIHLLKVRQGLTLPQQLLLPLLSEHLAHVWEAAARCCKGTLYSENRFAQWKRNGPITYSENRFAQEEGEVTIGCVGIYVNDVYAMAAHDSCMCTRQLHGLFQEIYTNICLKYQE